MGEVKILRCKHGMLPGQCAMCNGTVTAKNQTRIYGRAAFYGASWEEDRRKTTGPEKYRKDTKARHTGSGLEDIDDLDLDIRVEKDLEEEPEKEIAMEEISQNEEPKTPFCSVCHEHPAMVRKDNGKVVNGKCSFCHSKVMHRAKKQKIAGKINEIDSPKGDISILKSEFRQLDTPVSLVIDLTNHPDLYGYLIEAAKLRIRTPELQALAYIVKGLQSEDLFEVSEQP